MIGDDDDMSTLFPRIAASFPGLLSAALERVARGDPGDPQDASLAYEAPMFEDAWREIDWTQPARVIHNQVRSWNGGRGTPLGAFGTLDGARALVLKTRLVATAPVTDATPGATLSRENGTLHVQCGDAPLEIVEWEPA